MASEVVLTLYDVVGIQSYVFASNELAACAGASWLVHRALAGPDDVESSLLLGRGVDPEGAAEVPASGRRPEGWLALAVSEEPGCRMEWTGGGNALVVSPTDAAARRVAGRFSEFLLARAPGLRIACSHAHWDTTRETYHGVVGERLLPMLAAEKAAFPFGVEFDGGGVTQTCHETGLPAVSRRRPADGDSGPLRWRAPASAAKLAVRRPARERLRSLVALDNVRCDGRPLVWSDLIDELGRSRGEKSLVGVVHFDGTRVGALFERASRDGLSAVSRLSSLVNRAATESVRAALTWVCDNLDSITDVDVGGFSLSRRVGTSGRLRSEHVFPVRPILWAGDDITLVCDGRIALDVAAELVNAWRGQGDELAAAMGWKDAEPLEGAVGVAVVKSHFPFYRAYALAEQLCIEGKREVKSRGWTHVSAIDWEIVLGGGIPDLGRRRREIHAAADGSRLHGGPYFVAAPTDAAVPKHRRWDLFRGKVVPAFRDLAEVHRVQVQAYAEALHAGERAAAARLELWRERFPGNERYWRDLESAGAGSAFVGRDDAESTTPHLDAIELLDKMVFPERSAASRSAPGSTEVHR